MYLFNRSGQFPRTLFSLTLEYFYSLVFCLALGRQSRIGILDDGENHVFRKYISCSLGRSLGMVKESEINVTQFQTNISPSTANYDAPIHFYALTEFRAKWEHTCDAASSTW